MDSAAAFFDEPRTFRARTPKAALAAVKAALGPDAIIMSCDEVAKTLFGPPSIEVVARSPHALDPSAFSLVEGASDDDAKAEPEPMAALHTPAPSLVPLARAGQAFGFSPHNNHPPRRKRQPPPRGRSIPRTPSHDGVPGPMQIEPAFLLTEMGLDAPFAREISAKMNAAADRETVLRHARRMVRNAVTLSRPPWTPDPTNERAVIALIGPTGAGKTTTVAKIAMRAMIERRLKVVLITLDHYRVGAADQLLRFGELMGCRVIAATDSASFTAALDGCADADLVLIDTAGRSPHDHEIIAQQSAALRLCPELERVLVLPASTSGRELNRVQARFLPLAIDRLITTKVDESEGPMSVASVAARLHVPLSAMCAGQSVAEDIERVTWDWLLDDFTPSQS